MNLRYASITGSFEANVYDTNGHDVTPVSVMELEGYEIRVRVEDVRSPLQGAIGVVVQVCVWDG